jgi:hypothetical protein
VTKHDTLEVDAWACAPSITVPLALSGSGEGGSRDCRSSAAGFAGHSVAAALKLLQERGETFWDRLFDGSTRPGAIARLPATMVSGPGCKRRFTSSRCTRVPGLQLEILKASTAGEIDAAFERRRASDARLRRHARTPRPTRMSRFKMCVGNIQISKFVHTIVGKN